MSIDAHDGVLVIKGPRCVDDLHIQAKAVQAFLQARRLFIHSLWLMIHLQVPDEVNGDFAIMAEVTTLVRNFTNPVQLYLYRLLTA